MYLKMVFKEVHDLWLIANKKQANISKYKQTKLQNINEYARKKQEIDCLDPISIRFIEDVIFFNLCGQFRNENVEVLSWKKLYTAPR